MIMAEIFPATPPQEPRVVNGRCKLPPRQVLFSTKSFTINLLRRHPAVGRRLAWCKRVQEGEKEADQRKLYVQHDLLGRRRSEKKVGELEECDLFDRQLLETFPKKELQGKVVMVRCDLNVVFKDSKIVDENLRLMVPTITYLAEVGSKVVLVSHWTVSKENRQTSSIADALCRLMNRRILWTTHAVGEEAEEKIRNLDNGDVLLLGNMKQYKAEDANDAAFSRALTAKVDHLVNDAFCVSHRVLASTVGAASFTCARLAGLQLAKELFFSQNILQSRIHPFIGGGKLSDKVDALHQLLSRCDKIFVTGAMVFPLLEAAGLPVPASCTERHMLSEALELLLSARENQVELVLPKDLMLAKDNASHLTTNITISQPVPHGWQPVDLGPESLDDIAHSVRQSKMVLWFGPCGMGHAAGSTTGLLSLARVISKQSAQGCITVAGGKDVVKGLREAGVISMISHVSVCGAAFWQLLKGRTLPGVASLDPVAPTPPDWERVYKDPFLPLTVDIGCGNGLFILKMAGSFSSRNFLGFEVFPKLVARCADSAKANGLLNAHFIAANATSSYSRIIASYPGDVSLVTIQCPDPNFSKPDSRWRMVQRQLVEAITTSLSPGGKVFLQSDVKCVLEALMQEFRLHGGGIFALSSEHLTPNACDENGWLNFNPLEASTDWEDHALQRGDRMFRVLLAKL